MLVVHNKHSSDYKVHVYGFEKMKHLCVTSYMEDSLDGNICNLTACTVFKDRYHTGNTRYSTENMPLWIFVMSYLPEGHR